MKVLVLHPITESFRTKNGGWSPRLENAISFESSDEAIQYCDQFVNDASQVILEFGSSSDERRKTVPLRKVATAEKGVGHTSEAMGNVFPEPQIV